MKYVKQVCLTSLVLSILLCPKGVYADSSSMGIIITPDGGVGFSFGYNEYDDNSNYHDYRLPPPPPPSWYYGPYYQYHGRRYINPHYNKYYHNRGYHGRPYYKQPPPRYKDRHYNRYYNNQQYYKGNNKKGNRSYNNQQGNQRRGNQNYQGQQGRGNRN